MTGSRPGGLLALTRKSLFPTSSNSTTGKTVGDILFVARVNVASFTDVDDDGLSDVSETIHRHGLGFAELRPGGVPWVILFLTEISQLHVVEGEVSLAPFVTPVLDHQREQVAVLVCPVGVGFSLIPDGSTDAVSDGWM